MRVLTIIKAAALAAIVGWVVPMAPAKAEEVTYECVAQRRQYPSEVWGRFRNLIQPRMVFVVDEAARTATVWDPLIEQVYGGAVEGNLREESDRKLVVTWDIFSRGFNLAQARMEFRASLIKQSNKLIVTAVPIGYPERFFARGGCVQTS